MSEMQYLTPKTSIKELNQKERRSSSAQAVAEIMFVKMAQEQQLDEVTINEYPDLFVEWDENWRGSAGSIVQDEGQLYRSIHDVTNEGLPIPPPCGRASETLSRSSLSGFSRSEHMTPMQMATK